MRWRLRGWRECRFRAPQQPPDENRLQQQTRPQRCWWNGCRAGFERIFGSELVDGVIRQGIQRNAESERPMLIEEIERKDLDVPVVAALQGNGGGILPP